MATTTAMTTKHISHALVRFAWFAVAYNILVILWGGLVRATGSGAGCGNHWPLCNGQVVPLSPRVDTVIEFTHRCMTGGAAFVVLGLLVWTFRSTMKGQAARVAAVAATVLLVNEAILGAVLVKLGYVTGNQSMGRVVVLSIHLSNTLLLLAALTLTAVLLKTGQLTRDLRLRGATAVWTLIGLIATIVVGVSGSLAALGDTLFPSSSLRMAIEQDLAAGSPLLLRLRGLHPASALVAGALCCLAVDTGEAPRIGQAYNGGSHAARRAVCFGSSGCCAASAGMDADCAPARSGFVLGRLGRAFSGVAVVAAKQRPQYSDGLMVPTRLGG